MINTKRGLLSPQLEEAPGPHVCRFSSFRGNDRNDDAVLKPCWNQKGKNILPPPDFWSESVASYAVLLSHPSIRSPGTKHCQQQWRQRNARYSETDISHHLCFSNFSQLQQILFCSEITSGRVYWHTFPDIEPELSKKRNVASYFVLALFSIVTITEPVVREWNWCFSLFIPPGKDSLAPFTKELHLYPLLSEWVSEWVSCWMSEWLNELLNEWLNEWLSG